MGKQHSTPIDSDLLRSMVEKHKAEKKKPIPSQGGSGQPGTNSLTGLPSGEIPDEELDQPTPVSVEASGKPDGLNSFIAPADLSNPVQPKMDAPSPLTNKGAAEYQQKQDAQQQQLKAALGAYDANHPVINLIADDTKVDKYKEPSFWDKTKFGAKYLGAQLLTGTDEVLEGVAHLGKMVSDLNTSKDADTLARKKKQAEKYASDSVTLAKLSRLGIKKEVVEGGTNSKLINAAGSLLKMVPAIVGAESTGGATFYLQNVGTAAEQVKRMKDSGVKFDNNSDELFIQGQGLIGYLLGKSVYGTVASKMGRQFTNDIIGSLSAEATKDLASLGAKATLEDIANVYVNKALTFSQRLGQYGLGILKTYPKIATEFAGANLLGSGLKATVNAMNDGREPLGAVTGDEIAKDIISPVYNGDTPANGDLKQFAENLLTSPAAAFSLLHAATSSGMLFDKSPYKNAVVESLQTDNSPEAVQKIKDELTGLGKTKGWSEDEIANTNSTIEMLADVTGKIPRDIPVPKFHRALDLVLGRRQLDAVLKETQARKSEIDPALAAKAAPFETLLVNKIDQANDKLAELISDKKYQYGEVDGQFYKQMPGEEFQWISKDRYDLENIEAKAKTPEEAPKIIPGPPVVVESGGKKVKLSTDDVDYLRKQKNDAVNSVLDGKEENTTLSIKNNEVADNIISMLDQRDIKAKESGKTEKAKPNDLSDKEYSEFIDKGEVSQSTVEAIAIKVRDKSVLTDREKAVFAAKTKEVNEALLNQTKVAIRPKSDNDDLDDLKQPTSKPVSAKIATTEMSDDLDALKRPENETTKAKTSIQKEEPFNAPTNVEINDDTVDHEAMVGKSWEVPVTDDNGKYRYTEKYKIKKSLYYPNEGYGYEIERDSPMGGKDTGKYSAKFVYEAAKSGSLNISLKPNIDEPKKVEAPAEVPAPSSPAKQPAEVSSVTDSPSPDDLRIRDKAIDAIRHGVVVPENLISGDHSPRFDFGLTAAEKKKGMSDIVKGKYDTAPARKLIDKVSEWERTGEYPIIMGAGGAAVRSTYATPEQIQEHIDEAKQFQVNKDLKPEEVADINQGLKDLGITHQDILDYEQYQSAITEQIEANQRAAGSTEKNVQGTGNDGGTGAKKATGRTAAQGEPVKTEQPKAEEPASKEEAPPVDEPKEEKTEQQKKREQFDQELKDAKEAFRKTFNKAMSGVNPETIEKGLKLMAVYAKIGLHDFGAIVKDMYADFGDGVKDAFEGLKAAYGAFGAQEATDAQLDLMTDLREVRRAKIEDFITKQENGSEPTTLEENTPPVPERQSAGEVNGDVSGQNVEEVPGRKNDGSREVGSPNEKESAIEQQSGGTRPGNRSSTGARSRGKQSGEPASDIFSNVPEDTAKRELKPEDQNHRIKAGDTLVPTGEVGKFNGNLNAIFQLAKLEKENRNPTPEEKRTLAQFVGWGGLAKYLDVPYEKRGILEAVDAFLNGKEANVARPGTWMRTKLDFRSNSAINTTKYDNVNDLVEDIRKNLVQQGFNVTPDDLRAPLVKTLLSADEYRTAQNSTINAYYTGKDIISKVWKIAEHLGFKGGRTLESSAGIGHFFGLLPDKLQGKTALTGFELESLTGRMLQKLYPEANIQVKGFEQSRVPVNSVDLAIGNVPFGQTAPYDKNFPELSKFNMHNYFIAKNLRLLKPGGNAILITSSSTMDSPAAAKFREWVSAPDGGNSFLVGAIRLPSNAFSENAGTEVTSDVLIFQKRTQLQDTSLEQPFRYIKNLGAGIDRDGSSVPIDVNEYFLAHPENMLGTMMTAHEAGSGGLYSSARTTLKATEGKEIGKEMERVIATLPKDTNTRKVAEVKEDAPTQTVIAMDKKEGSVFTKSGKLYRVSEGEGSYVALDDKKLALAKDYVGVKGSLLDLIKMEQTAAIDADIETLRKTLNKAYDSFVDKYGNINGRGANFLEALDIDYPIVSSLENIKRSLVNEKGKDKIVQDISKGDILTKRINYPRTEPTQAADLADAINISLNYRTGIDLDYVASLTGSDAEAVRKDILEKELAFENPDTGLLETPEEYLSGYVREKLRAADTAALTDPAYRRNVDELKKVVPTDIPSSLISYSLGASWIPSSIFEQFAESIFETPIKATYLPTAGKYSMSAPVGKNNAKISNTYAAGGRSGFELLDDTMNNRQTIVMDTIQDPVTKSKKQVRNPEKTAAAQAMQQQLQDEFETWIKGNDEALAITEKEYNDIFNGQVLRNYRIPEFKHFPDASTSITLREHQKRAVSRGLSESTLFAHEVGSGKTFSIITTAMEMRRLGTARKPLIGVQNSTLGQFVASFKALYPGAKLLVPSAKEMEAEGRKKLFAKIATGDWDAVILPHSQISMIPDDPERASAYINEQIQEMITVQAEMERGTIEYRQMESEIKKLQAERDALTGEGEETSTKKKSGQSAAKSIAKKSQSISSAMEKALDRKVDNVLNFEEMGIDAILMDEAHRYKRLGFQTNMRNIKGIDTSKSQRSQSMLLKTRWIQEKTGGKNVLFYTGTPISNTMAEAWTMMKYVRPEILNRLGIDYFDQFAKTFGQVIPSLEQTGGGTFKVQNRFAKFQNLPEFITAFRAATDVVLSSDVKEFQEDDSLPKLKDGRFTQVIIPQSPELKKQIRSFRDTLEAFEKMTGKEKKENSHIPLVIFNKAKQASIDLRLLDPNNVDSPQSKVNDVITNTLRIYKETTGKKGVQMIFSDMYQSPEPKDQFLDEDRLIVNPAFGKARFNLFNDIKAKLIKGGVPANEIVIFTEPKYDKAERKEQVFEDANNGTIRFLLGTTEKMGVGVNAQRKMAALHHVDAPARPMDYEQRNGRIIRQGNENKEVEVLTYGVEKTLDSSAFQRLSTKQKFINQVMKGENLERVTEDPADEVQMTFDEMMAQLSDSPFAMQKLLVDNKLRSERMKSENFRNKIKSTNRDLQYAKNELRNLNAQLADQERFAEVVQEKFADGNIISLEASGKIATEKFGNAAETYIQQLMQRFMASPTHYAKGMIKVNGIAVELEIKGSESIHKKTHEVAYDPRLTYTVPEVGIVHNSYGSGIEVYSNSGQGLMTSLRSKITDVMDGPISSKREIAHHETNIVQLEKDVQATFDESKLKALEQESEELKGKMLADNAKRDDEEEPSSIKDQILDQSNIKPALDFLDGMKSKGGILMSTIVPIPPAVWNGAIEVMKNILKATNSTQKALRIAAQYIIDKGGSTAQAKDFEQTVGDKIRDTEQGRKAIKPDVEDDVEITSEDLVKTAKTLQRTLKTADLSPTERILADVDVSDMTRKELHRYVEITSVLAVDPEGVLTKDVNNLLRIVANRRQPKSGTAVDTPDMPPRLRRTIERKERLPMDAMAEEEPVSSESPDPKAKELYSLMGHIKNIRVRNLNQLSMFSEDMRDMNPLRAVRQFVTSKSQSSVIMKTATDRIVKLVGQEGWKTLRQALVESRLRGIRTRWENWASQIKESSDNEIDDLFENGKLSPLYGIIKNLEGYENDENPAETIVGMLTNGEYDDAREYVSEMFSNAAHNVARYDKLANGRTFDDMVDGSVFRDTAMQEALKSYKNLIESPLRESHESNEGVFSDSLGPLDTYYPLINPEREKQKFVATKGTEFKAPDNNNNRLATGQGEQYSDEISQLSNMLSGTIRNNNRAGAIKALENAGLLAKVTKDAPDTGTIEINGEVYTATRVPYERGRIVTDAPTGNSVSLPTRYFMIPDWLYREVKTIFEGEPKDDFSLFGKVNNTLIKYMLGGPIEATSHSYRLLGGIVNAMPYMQEWAYNNGILGHAGGLMLNNPFVKTFVGLGRILYTDISSEEALQEIQEMAKIGVIPEKTWTKTWSKEFAELNGAKKVPIWDFSPVLYGKRSLDLKARVMMYRLSKALNPDASPEQLVKMQNELGNYTTALQGELERFVKRHGIAPFYSFGGAIYRSGIKAVFGSTALPLERPSLKEMFTTKTGRAAATKLMTYKMAQLLSTGVIGLVGYWAMIYHAQTKKWPWEDQDSKLLQLPFPEWAKNDELAKMFANPETGKYDNINMSFFNPFLNRGLRAVGAPKGYETAMLGGTNGQVVENASTQAINTNLSPYTSSPAINIGVTTLSGAAPYITGVRDLRGAPDLGLYRRVKTFDSGMQFPANFAVGLTGLNPLVSEVFSPLTKSLRFEYGTPHDMSVYSMGKAIINTLLPNSFTPGTDSEKKAKFLDKNQKAIEKTMEREGNKESAKSGPAIIP